MEKITRYPSIAALALAAEAIEPTKWLLRPDGHKWFGSERVADSLRMARVGNDSLVPEAEKLLAQINAAIDLPERPMVADCGGAYPIVPDYLMGVPDCMRRRAVVESDESPLSVYVCLTSSGDLSAATMMARGTAILALVMALAPVRAIDLNVFNIGRESDGSTESVIVAPINTRPLDLAGACYVLTSAGFTRGLCYALARAIHFGARCGISYPEQLDSPSYYPDLLRRLGGDPARDLILPCAHEKDPMIDDPADWVNAQLAAFRESL